MKDLLLFYLSYVTGSRSNIEKTESLLMLVSHEGSSFFFNFLFRKHLLDMTRATISFPESFNYSLPRKEDSIVSVCWSLEIECILQN